MKRMKIRKIVQVMAEGLTTVHHRSLSDSGR